MIKIVSTIKQNISRSWLHLIARIETGGAVELPGHRIKVDLGALKLCET